MPDASSHKFRVGDLCTFTNKGSNTYNALNGKPCKVVELRSQNTWDFPSQPEYKVCFPWHRLHIRVWESELEQIM